MKKEVFERLIQRLNTKHNHFKKRNKFFSHKKGILNHNAIICREFRDPWVDELAWTVRASKVIKKKIKDLKKRNILQD